MTNNKKYAIIKSTNEGRPQRNERVFFMKIYSEKAFNDFEFWSGAKDRAEKLTIDEGNAIFEYLEECYPGGMSETEINDFFWFEEETIAEILGFNSFEEIYNRE